MILRKKRAGRDSPSVYRRDFGVYTEGTWGKIIGGFKARWQTEEETRQRLLQFKEKRRGLGCSHVLDSGVASTNIFLTSVADFEELLKETQIPGTAGTHEWTDSQGNQRFLVSTPTPTKPCGDLGRSQIADYNKRLLELAGVQGSGDVAERLRQFVQCTPVKKAAHEILDIHWRFDPQAALKIRTQGNFTNKQLQLLRLIDVYLPDFYSLKEEEDKLLFPFEIVSADLEIHRLKEGEEWTGKFGTVVEVVLPFLFFFFQWILLIFNYQNGRELFPIKGAACVRPL